MKTYLVGGAVRDKLLGRSFQERDWLVVGAAAEELLAQGYRQVGKDFPVFLHPVTGEEYALARTERKTAPGYQGFAFDTAPGITVEQDLQRRDLTVNAIAQADDGSLVDPWGGREDLERRLLRHVSLAFREDPVRILRTARFAAELTGFGFRVAAETMQLMHEMVASGEADALRPERVWKETQRALGAPRPDVFVDVLRACGALAVIYPEVDALFGIPQPPRWHPEIDTGVHILMALRISAGLSDNPAVRFAVLTHDLGKATTDPAILPSHHGHEQRSVGILRTLCARLPVPRAFQELAEAVASQHGKVHRIAELRPATVLDLLEKIDALRRPERCDDVLHACEADARGRGGLEAQPYPQADVVRRALAAANTVQAKDLPNLATLRGPEIGAALREARIAAVRRALKPPKDKMGSGSNAPELRGNTSDSAPGGH